MQEFAFTLHTVTTESDSQAAFRAELKRCREEHRWTPAFAAKRAGVTAQWWRQVERGTETVRGVSRIVYASRKNVINMGRAVGLSPNAALSLAGLPPLSAAEVRQLANDPRCELTLLADDLSDARVRALVAVARTMEDPNATLSRDPESAGTDDEVIILGPHETVEDHHTERDGTGKSRQT